MGLTRRDVIKAGLAAPFAALAGTEPAYANPALIAAIAAVGMFVKLLQSQQGDGGTGAILSAINGKLDIIISQLAVVQTALAQITSQIEQVKDEVLRAISQQYAIQLFNAAKTGLVAIRDVQREADYKGISLKRGADRQGLEERLERAWNEFDVARRRLREYDQGRGLIAAPLLDAMVLADHSAFAAGIIDETQFAIVLGRHLDWINSMIDPRLEFSVTSFEIKAKENEASMRAAIASSARNPADAVSIIATNLLKGREVRICAITTLDVEYYSEFQFRSWRWLRNNEYLMAPTYTVKYTNHNGAHTYEDVTYDQNYEYRLTLGNSHILYQSEGVSYVDLSQCTRFSNGEIHLPYEVSVQGNFLHEVIGSPAFDRGIGSYVFGNFIDKSTFARTISTNGKETAVAVQLLIDKVNLEILNQRLAQLATETISGNRRFAESLAAALPIVPQDRP